MYSNIFFYIKKYSWDISCYISENNIFENKKKNRETNVSKDVHI